MIFGTLLTIALIPTGSHAQEYVVVQGQVEIKKEKPLPSEYEGMLQTPGRVVISTKYPVGDPSLGMFVRSSYRENTPRLKVYTLHIPPFSVDFEKIPLLVSDLENLVKLVRAAEGRDEDISFRFSDDAYASFYSYRVSGVLKHNLLLYLGRQSQSPKSNESLPLYIEAFKQGYSKLLELKRAR